MTINGDVKWAYGGKFVLIDDKGRFPSGNEIATWLKAQPEDIFITELTNMVKTGYMSDERARKTLNAYVKEAD